MYSSAVFARGSTFLHSNFTSTELSPINHSWHQKTRHWAIRWLRLHRYAFPHFDTILECDGRTDRRTDGRICHSIYSTCKVSFAAPCRNQHNLHINIVLHINTITNLLMMLLRSPVGGYLSDGVSLKRHYT